MIATDLTTYTILIVDDSPQDIQYIGSILKNEGYSIAYAQNGNDALKKIEKTKFDLILLDVIMPSMDGFTVCSKIKEYPQYKEVPIIFLTADTENIIKGFEIGGVDYVTKPFKGAELLARVRNQFHLQKSQMELINMNTKLEKLVQERTKKLEEALHELDVFFYRASHDLRSPLANLNGINYLFELEVKDPVALEYHQITKQVVGNLLELNSSIIQVGNIRAHKINKTNIELYVFIQNILGNNPIFNKNKVSLNFKNQVILHSDSYFIEIIVYEILKNAFQYSFPETLHIQVEVKEDENNFSILIKDNGVGIREDVISMIFRMFFKGNERSKGYGLGLYKAKLCADALRANIICKSKLKEGTCFEIEIPK